MKQMFTRYFFMALVMSAMIAHDMSAMNPQGKSSGAMGTKGGTSVVSQIKIRPQSVDKARQTSGEVPGSFITHLPDMDNWYGTFNTAIVYNRSMNSDALASALFGADLQTVPGEKSSSWFCNKSCDSSQIIKIQGTAVENRDANAWRANDFYLGPKFDGTLSVKPTISNFMVDLNVLIGLDRWVSGLHLRLFGPFVHTRWDLKATETVTQTTDAVFAFKNAQSFFAGDTPPANPVIYGPGPDGTEFNIKQNALMFHKMAGFRNDSVEGSCEKSCGNSLTKNGFGELRAELGWDFLIGDDYHASFYLAGAAPTGTKANAEYLFGPQIGNNQKWELGLGLSGHYLFWRSEDEDSHFGIYSDVVVTHLFKSREQRVFDLAPNGPMSRYMLAARMVSPTENGLLGSATEGDATGDTEATDPIYQFGNEFMPVANLTAQDVNVSVGAQLDMVAWLNYTMGGFTFDVGYNLWLQSCEKISCSDKCGPQLAADKNTWVLIGDSFLYGAGLDDQFDYPIPFSQSKATLTTGANGEAYLNDNVDNAQYASNLNSAGTTGTRQTITDGGDENGDNPEQIFLSSPVKFLSASDINMEQKNSAITHSIYGYAGYVVQREEGIEPFFGLGGKAEFGTSNRTSCESTKTTCSSSSCPSFSVSTWEVYGKIGFSFN